MNNCYVMCSSCVVILDGYCAHIGYERSGAVSKLLKSCESMDEMNGKTAMPATYALRFQRMEKYNLVCLFVAFCFDCLICYSN